MFKGIDLSVWNEDVDYTKLKEQGIEFAIIRCGYGKDKSQKDKMFEKHYEGLRQAGIKIGCYHYSYCNNINNAILEAENCLEYIKGKDFDLPVFYDLEEKTTSALGKDTVTEIAKIFCDRIKQAGYKAGVYANLDWFQNYINVNEIEKDYYIWLAQWSEKHSANFRVDFWQYTSNGKILGIPNNVDLNYQLTELEENTKIYESKKSIEELANEVIEGKWGNGEERKNRLTESAYNYDEVQNLVNKKLSNKIVQIYIVKPGDNLTKIAKMFNTTVDKIAQDNNIKNKNLIFINQKLFIK